MEYSVRRATRILGRFLRWLYVACVVLATVVVALANVRVHTGHRTMGGPAAPAVVAHLRALSADLRGGAGERMQSIYPEGFFFSHVLGGLAWVEVGRAAGANSDLRREAIGEARWMLGRLDSPAGRAPFVHQSASPPFGVFYAGWSARLAGEVLSVQSPAERDSHDVETFERACTEIGEAIQQSPTPFLCAYAGQAWPCDAVVAMGALALHDRILEPRFTQVIGPWVARARAKVDPVLGLLPHFVDPQTGEAIVGPRGSSQAIINAYLPEIDAGWGAEHYAAFRAAHFGSLMGIPGIREYPNGSSGAWDVDSGPLVGGLSAPASLAAIAAARANSDTELADALLDVGEGAGVALGVGGTRRYVAGLFPLADAFMVWAATRPAANGAGAPVLPRIVSPNWRWTIHGLSILIVGATWSPVIWRRVRGKHGKTAKKSRGIASRDAPAPTATSPPPAASPAPPVASYGSPGSAR
jgi:hypothetical protein